MLKKLFVTAAAAAAVSVPLAGVAWAEPPADPGAGNGNGIGKGCSKAAAKAVTDIGLPTDPPSALFPDNKLSPADKEFPGFLPARHSGGRKGAGAPTLLQAMGRS